MYPIGALAVQELLGNKWVGGFDKPKQADENLGVCVLFPHFVLSCDSALPSKTASRLASLTPRPATRTHTHTHTHTHLADNPAKYCTVKGEAEGASVFLGDHLKLSVI
jgi:hypothetical protein